MKFHVGTNNSSILIFGLLKFEIIKLFNELENIQEYLFNLSKYTEKTSVVPPLKESNMYA